MAHRLGSAFVLLGVILLTLFVVTFAAEQGDPLTLLAGADASANREMLRAITESLPETRHIPISLSPLGLRVWDSPVE